MPLLPLPLLLLLLLPPPASRGACRRAGLHRRAVIGEVNLFGLAAGSTQNLVCCGCGAGCKRFPAAATAPRCTRPSLLLLWGGLLGAGRGAHRRSEAENAGLLRALLQRPLGQALVCRVGVAELTRASNAVAMVKKADMPSQPSPQCNSSQPPARHGTLAAAHQYVSSPQHHRWEAASCTQGSARCRS